MNFTPSFIEKIVNNINPQSNKYLFCPSGNCLNTPEIFYSFNPLKSELQYNCKCNPNNNQKINMNIQEFIDKSKIICNDCKKAIIDENFMYCLDCKKTLDNYCGNDHIDKLNHLNFNFVNKNKILNLCDKHKAPFIFRCMDCNESLCHLCEFNEHNLNNHSLKQFKEFIINQKDLDNINSTLEKQKSILDKIKNINNNIINSLENDIKIKQKIINSYQNNKTDYNSIINMKNLYLKNNQKFENILQNYLNKKEENIINKKDSITKDDFIDESLLFFYYRLMINKDDNLNNSLINKMEKKINNLNDNNIMIHNNENRIINNINNNNIIGNNSINQGFSIFSSINNINNINKNDENQINSNMVDLDKAPIISQRILDKKIKIKNSLSFPKIKIHKNAKKNKSDSDDSSDSEKSIGKIKKEKLKKRDKKITEKSNYYVNNMILLKSGNFALSIQRRVEIYKFQGLRTVDGKNIYSEKSIKNSNCLIQKIRFYKNRKSLSCIFEFLYGFLLCSLYSNIYIVKLTKSDYDYEVVGLIDLDKLELPRKMISLGDSLLVTLIEQRNDCIIKVYKKIDNFNDIINNNLLKIERQRSNSLFSRILNQQNEQDNKIQIHIFDLIIKNLNEKKIRWSSIFEIKKNNIINNFIFNKGKTDDYLYEFIATSNEDCLYGKDKLIFFGIKKDEFGLYSSFIIKEIDNISCSIKPDSICQLNEKYLCIGLQNFNRIGQSDGFAIIDISSREIFKVIKDDSITSLSYDKESNLLLASMEINEKRKSYYATKLYKLIYNKGERGKDEFEFKNIYKHKNKQKDLITSVQKIKIPSEEYIYFVTSSEYSDLEIARVEIQKLQN